MSHSLTFVKNQHSGAFKQGPLTSNSAGGATTGDICLTLRLAHVGVHLNREQFSTEK